MLQEKFGEYLRKTRESKDLPLRKVAAHLDIDTSTLSKVERGERPVSSEYLKPLSDILEVELREVQVHYITDRIKSEFGSMEFVMAGLKEAEKQLKGIRK